MNNLLTIGIITFNEEERIKKTILSCKKLTNNILVIDSFSTDRTLEICKELDVKVIQNIWEGYCNQKNFMIKNCKTKWILSLDSDEILTEKIIDNIRHTIKNNYKYSGYYLHRYTVFNDVKLNYIFWNDYPLRLFINKNAYFKGSPHDKLIIDGKKKILKGDIVHYSFKNVYHHLEKCVKYGKLLGMVKLNKNIYSNIFFIFINCFIQFFKLYIFKLGFLDGIYGIYFSFTHVLASVLKYYYLYILKYKVKETKYLKNLEKNLKSIDEQSKLKADIDFKNGLKTNYVSILFITYFMFLKYYIIDLNFLNNISGLLYSLILTLKIFLEKYYLYIKQ